MNAEELGLLVTRLIADTANYQKNMEAAARTVEDTGKSMGNTTAKVQTMTETITTYADTLQSALGMVGMAFSMKAALSAATAAEDVQVRLAFEAKQHGLQVENLTEQYKEWVGAIAQTTTVSKGQAYAMLESAHNVGLFGTAAQDAGKLAIGLQQVIKGMAPEQAMRVVGRALTAGNLGRLGYMLPGLAAQLRGVKDEAQKTAIITKFLTDKFELAQELAGTTGGQLTRLNNSFGAIKKQFGSAIAEGVRPFISSITDLVKWVGSLGAPFYRVVATFGALITSVLTFTSALKLLRTLGINIFSPWVLLLGAIAIGLETNRNLTLSLVGVALTLYGAYKLLQLVGIISIAVWNTRIFQYVAIIAIYTVAIPLMVALKLATLAEAAATWLGVAAWAAWTASLLAFLAAAGVFIVIGATIWAGILAGVAAVGAAITAVRDHSDELANVWGGFTKLLEPLKAVGGVLGEWGSILGHAIKAASVDMKLAWRILVVGWELAVEQVKNLWPPLFAYITEEMKPFWAALGDAASLTMDYISRVFRGKFKSTLAFMYIDLYAEATKKEGAFTSILKRMFGAALPAPETVFDLRSIAENAASDFGKAGFDTSLKGALLKAKDAAGNIKPFVAPGDTTSIQRLRNELKALYGETDNLKKRGPDQTFKNIGNAAVQAGHDVKNLTSVLVGSAEAMTLIDDQRKRELDTLQEWNKAGGGAPAGAGGPPVRPGGAVLAGGPPATSAEAVSVLIQIRDILTAMQARGGLQIQAANIG